MSGGSVACSRTSERAPGPVLGREKELKAYRRALFARLYMMSALSASCTKLLLEASAKILSNPDSLDVFVAKRRGVAVPS